jgi:hypothetical protein
MVVGHFSVGFVAKAMDKRIPLWILFIAAEFADVLWAILVLVGIEKARIVPGITASNPLDLYYYPFSHSLLASFIWFGIVVVGYRLLRPGEGTWRIGLIIGGALFLHWVLDLVVHRPDLPLYDNTAKVGLGLWDFPIPAFLLEAGLLLAGLLIYLRVTSPRNTVGRFGTAAFSAVLLIIQAGISFGPAFSSMVFAATGTLVLIAFSTITIYWLEKKRF